MKTTVSWVSIALMAFLLGCAKDAENPKQSEMDYHRATWNNQAIEQYTYDYVPNCFCDIGGVKFSIEVKNNAIVSVYNQQTGAVVDPADYHSSFRTINGLFDLIQAAIKANAASINATYSKEKGYPESIYIDYNEMMADEEFGATVTNFIIH